MIAPLSCLAATPAEIAEETIIGSLPALRILRIIGPDFKGAADHLASIGQRIQQAQADGLDQDVADGRRFHGAGQHLPVTSVGRELAEQGVLRSSANNMNHIQSSAK